MNELSLFNADALILFGAVALILLLACSFALLALLIRSRVGAIAALLGVLALVGFLPWWTSLLWLFLPTGQEPAAASSSYFWLVFAAVIHLDRLFAIGALLSGIVYFAIPGTQRARLLRTLWCLAAVLVAAVVYSVIQLYRHALLS